MKRRLLAATALLAITACSKADDSSANREAAPAATEAADASAESAAGSGTTSIAEHPPAIDANIAPGVAFDYTYAFSLPEVQIARVQEEHAALCAKLGVSHCRVTGLAFNKERDGSINAHMAFKLDPALALRFARDATDLVDRADGNLETSDVKGEDVGSGIIADDKTVAGIKAELAKIDVQLKIPGLSRDVRGGLVAQAGELRAQLRNLEVERDAKVETLATTPVLFNYEPGDTLFGMSRSSPLRQGLSTGQSSFAAMFAFLALLIGAAGPWLLAGGAIFWAVRRFTKRTRPATEVV